MGRVVVSTYDLFLLPQVQGRHRGNSTLARLTCTGLCISSQTQTRKSVRSASVTHGFSSEVNQLVSCHLVS